jgi:hypothetical protein
MGATSVARQRDKALANSADASGWWITSEIPEAASNDASRSRAEGIARTIGTVRIFPSHPAGS